LTWNGLSTGGALFVDFVDVGFLFELKTKVVRKVLEWKVLE
jgi:hypothetical protein